MSDRQPAGLRAGTVRAFDDEVGLGTLEPAVAVAVPGAAAAAKPPAPAGSSDAAAAAAVPFHCTAIADGSRHIEAGTEVLYLPVARHRGRIEAWGIVPRC